MTRETIAVDLDGTLANYDHYRGDEHVGDPIWPMMQRVRTWLSNGQDVAIFTARADSEKKISVVRKWLERHGLPNLDITNVKRPEFVEIWDDRAIGIRRNTGLPVTEPTEESKPERLDVDLSDKRVLIWDYGTFSHIAKRLSQEFGHVDYFCAERKGNPISRDALVGAGIDGVEETIRFWDLVDRADLIVFPDVQDGDTMEFLRNYGKRVWGCGRGGDLELDRVFLKNTLKSIGLPVGKYEVVTGLNDLATLLSEHEDLWVKISRYRGDDETWHHSNMAQSEIHIDRLRCKLGPVGSKIMPFVVEWPIKSMIEVGGDHLCVNAKFAKTNALFGYEIKDKAYIGSVRKYAELPKEVLEVNAALGPVLASMGYRGHLSSEIRVPADEKPYLTDITCRLPSPGSESQAAIYRNLGEMIYYGAAGVVVEPETEAPLVGQVCFLNENSEGEWSSMRDSTTKDGASVTVYYECDFEGVRYSAPSHCQEKGWIVATGETIEEVVRKLEEKADFIEKQGFTVQIDSLREAIKEISEGEEKGIEFTESKIPSPEIVGA